MAAMSAADWGETPELLTLQGEQLLVDTTTEATLNYPAILARIHLYL
jgi:hypothetical protein